ncbi:MAG: SpaA isopeptide-forming pilin-related protein [Lachnospiraceae bacterium]
MKTMKKIIAVLLMVVMVMPMALAMSVSAAGTATITVDDADAATLSYVQVINADTTTETGWAFTSTEAATAYKEAFGTANEQDVIWSLIKYQIDKDDTIADKAAAYTAAGIPATIVAATPAQIANALSKVAASAAYSSMANPQTVSAAGIYAIKATETGYTYNNMAAYVGFGGVEGDTYPLLQNTTITAKKSPISLVKTDDDADQLVYTGQTVTFTVKVNVPFIDPGATNKNFFVTDVITGAEFVDLATGTVTMAGNPVGATFVQGADPDDNKFRIDLSSLIDDANSNAGKEIVVTYQAKVTAIAVDNQAYAGNDPDSYTDETYGKDDDKLYSGQITFTKTAEDGTTKLEGADFVVYKLVDETKNYAIFDATNKLTGWTTVKGEATTLTTGVEGTIVVYGLDLGDYYFEETKAPQGYSLNTEAVKVTVALTDAQDGSGEPAEANKTYSLTGSMKDTKLSALPETGGMGTYIFTILGVAVMAFMALQFMKSRKVEEE